MTSENILAHVIGQYVIPAICMFGIVCNILNMVVLTRRTMTESPYTYLMGIAIADIALLILAFTEVVFSKRSSQGVYFWKFYDSYIFLPFANVFANSTVWVTVLMTIERFISVRFPLRAKELCTKTLARRCIASVFIIAVIINIPRFFCLKIVKMKEGKYIIQSSDFELSPFYKGMTWFYIIIIHFIPLTVIGTLNSALLWAFYRAQRHRLELQEPSNTRSTRLPLQTSKEQRRLTVTCIVIILAFMICVIPSAFSNRPVAMLLFGRNKTLVEFTTSNTYISLRAVTNMLIFLNSSLNFIIYCVFNHKFVITLKFVMWKALYRICGERCLGKSRFRRLANATATVRTPSVSSVNQVLVYPPPKPAKRESQSDNTDIRKTRRSYYASPSKLMSSSSSSSLPSLVHSEPLIKDDYRFNSCSRQLKAVGLEE